MLPLLYPVITQETTMHLRITKNDCETYDSVLSVFTEGSYRRRLHNEHTENIVKNKG